MRVRRLWLVLVVLWIPTAARAHDHFADVCFAVSDAHESMLVGPHVTFSKTLPNPSKDAVVRTLSLIADVSGHWGSHDDIDVQHFFFMGGLRYTFARQEHQRKLPFVEALLGGVNIRNGESDSDPALAIGGGYEYVIKGSPAGWGIRVQGHYLVRPSDITPRLSVGIVKRFSRE